VLDATNDFALYIGDGDASRLGGIPADVLATARAAAHEEGRAGWKLTLHMPCYRPGMTDADPRALPPKLPPPHATPASELRARPEWDKTRVIAQILELRREAAKLLGFVDFAALSLVPKMAKDAREVLSFLDELVRRAKPHAEREYTELATFARERLGLATLEAWDLAYAAEKLKESRYAFSDEDVRAYFPEDRVVAGLFRLVETLYGVEIREASAPTWHPTVRFFEIVSRDAGKPVGQFYLDLYARPGKQGGA